MFKEFLSLFNPKKLPIINKTFWKGVAYTLLATLLVVLVWIITAYFSLSASFGDLSPTTILQSAEQKILAEYPDGLQLSMSHDGLLTKNIPGPIGFWKDPESKDQLGSYDYAVVFDDKPATVANYKSSGAFVYVGTDGVVTQDNNKQSLRTFLFQEMLSQASAENPEVSKFTGASLSKQDVESLMNEAIPYIANIILVGILIMILILPFILTISHLVWTVAVALIVLVIMKALKKETDYNMSYLTALYAGVPAVLLGSILSIFITVPFLQSILTVLFVLIGYYSVNKVN